MTASSACVIGLGYVGLPLALAEAGVSVVGFDANAERVAGLRAGRSGIADVPDSAITIPGLSFTADPGDIEACQACGDQSLRTAPARVSSAAGRPWLVMNMLSLSPAATARRTSPLLFRSSAG